MEQAVTVRQLRSFGLTVGGIFALISVWPALLRGQDVRVWAAALAGLLVIPALTFPRSLVPIYHVWMWVGEALGWINSRVILGAIFFVLFTPMGLVLRLLGKDPMHRSFEPGSDTYRVPRRFRPAEHMRHQF